MEISHRFFTLLCVFCCFYRVSVATKVSFDGRGIKIDDQRKILLSGSIHYPRSTTMMWPSLIKKAKDGGLNVIETYVFWNAHEPQRRQYDFSGNLDIVQFIKTIQNEGLYAVLRIGPYACAEWNYGGFPVWLHNTPNITMRTNNAAFKNEMQIFTTLIVDKLKQENLFASQGGPIIIAQIENEYGNIMAPYGEEGKEYVKWCADMAESQNIGVPWIMCQQADAPQPIINTCNGYYCDQFIPNNPDSPKMWTENWTGWFMNWGGKEPHRTAEDVAFAVSRFFQYGGTFQNYYMYHGGTNFGRAAGGPYISTTYDYDAPLNEYGGLNQPKWGHLKQLHLILRSMENILTNGVVYNTNYGSSVSATVYNLSGNSSCFLGNANEANDATISFGGKNYTLPAWSITILPDCHTEAYNTAKVNSQTSVMEKTPSGTGRTDEWEYKLETVQQINDNDSNNGISAPQLLDQKIFNDTSDYLWYMTSVNISEADPKNVTLRVFTAGHVLHAFVNNYHIGSQWATNETYNFTFEKSVELKTGLNRISLLSVTVGLDNYGSYFDTVEVGVRGPVELIGYRDNGESVRLDLSSDNWVYRVGLDGEQQRLYDPTRPSTWDNSTLPTNSFLTWYKASFAAPTGEDPVVVDLQGMGKGHAWVNGNSIGRYWPSFLAPADGCSSSCDYRGNYTSDKCTTNCGKPSQRWYHVPRSFLVDQGNILVLFEELGGNPSQVNFQTVSVGKVCGSAYEGSVLELDCQGGKVFTEIKFASFGNPQGDCGSFLEGTHQAPSTMSVIQKACLGKGNCSIEVTEATLGQTGYENATKRLAVEAVC